MSATHLFQITNTLILPAWLLLLFAPNHKITHRLVRSGFYSLIYSILYMGFIIIHFLNPNVGGFDSLQNVRLLFSSDWALLAGWIHYLAFDLFIGSHLVIKVEDNFILRFCLLFFTFMFGPIGLLFSKFIPQNKEQ